jgi:hypothetical protein
MKAIAGILVFAIAAYVAFQFLPPYFNNYQFSDDVNTIARFSGPAMNKTEEQIRDEVMKKAREYELPLRPEAVTIMRDQQKVTISAHYQRVVNLIGGKQVPLDFQIQSDK